MVWLVQPDAPEPRWWLPAFWFSDTTDLTVDICTPPTLSEGTWTFVDLELDLFRTPDGRAGIVDQDEFEELARSGYLTDSQARRALDAADALLQLVTDHAEPFGQAALPWLRSLQDRSPRR